MKAWLLDSLGGIENLRLGEVADPVAAAGEVVLQMRYAALNPADRYLAEGQYPARPPLPHILGRDGIGTVRQIGTGVQGFRVGQTLVVLRGEAGVSRAGTLAEAVAVPMESLVEMPAGWTEPEAAGATLVYMTAYQALTQFGELPPSVVLITGASGGVGVATTQLAHAMGHTVIGLSRSEEKAKKLKELGALAIFDPADTQWRRRVKELLGKGGGVPRRVDLAVDSIGGELFNDVLDTLGEWGKVSVVGRLAGPVPQFNTASLFFRRLRIGGVAVSSYSNAESRTAWKNSLELLAKTGAKPIVDRVFDFTDVPAAFARLKEGPMGKVVIRAK